MPKFEYGQRLILNPSYLDTNLKQRICKVAVVHEKAEGKTQEYTVNIENQGIYRCFEFQLEES